MQKCGPQPKLRCSFAFARVELQESLRALVQRLGPPQVEADAAEPTAVGEVDAFGAPDELHVTFAPLG